MLRILWRSRGLCQKVEAFAIRSLNPDWGCSTDIKSGSFHLHNSETAAIYLANTGAQSGVKRLVACLCALFSHVLDCDFDSCVFI